MYELDSTRQKYATYEPGHSSYTDDLLYDTTWLFIKITRKKLKTSRNRRFKSAFESFGWFGMLKKQKF